MLVINIWAWMSNDQKLQEKNRYSWGQNSSSHSLWCLWRMFLFLVIILQNPICHLQSLRISVSAQSKLAPLCWSEAASLSSLACRVLYPHGSLVRAQELLNTRAGRYVILSALNLLLCPTEQGFSPQHYWHRELDNSLFWGITCALQKV